MPDERLGASRELAVRGQGFREDVAVLAAVLKRASPTPEEMEVIKGIVSLAERQARMDAIGALFDG